LSKTDRQAQRARLSPAPNAQEVRRRMEVPKQYRWSSYRAYLGLVPPPRWLECQTVLGLGGGAKAQQRVRYRDYVENAVREGLERGPWESVREQVVLGGKEFLRQLSSTSAGTSRSSGARRLMAERPTFAAVVAAVEKVKGRKWAEFRDEHGDSGRDLALYLGRRVCGLKLLELAKEAGMSNYGVVATNARRYELRLGRDRTEQSRAAQTLKLFNCEM
jgi:putative transposase